MSSINAAAIAAKHRGNAEGSVRVLGQTAAVAGISGALLLALKALVLVAPAVLPGGDGLDALGRPNAIAAPAIPAPVTFEPASADLPIGSSERTAPTMNRTVTIPTTTTKTVTVTTPPTVETPTPPSAPLPPSTPVDLPKGPVGTITKPVEDLLDGVVPGVGTTVKRVTGKLDETASSLPLVGDLVDKTAPAVLGGGSSSGQPAGGVLAPLAPVTAPVTTIVGGLLGG